MPSGKRTSKSKGATQPRGEATRLDRLRARLAADLRAALVLADTDRDLGEALDRWELSLFQNEPFRSEQLRESLAALLGGADGLWAAAADILRRALVQALGHGDRAELVATLDESILGLRPRPAPYVAAVRLAG